MSTANGPRRADACDCRSTYPTLPELWCGGCWTADARPTAEGRAPNPFDAGPADHALYGLPARPVPALAWQDRVTLLLIEKHYTFAARVEIVAHAEAYGSVWCCPVFAPEDEADRAEVEALLPASDDWVEGWVDWYVYGTTEPTNATPERRPPVRLTKRHKEFLADIADGWRPFPFQLSGLEKALLRHGLVRGEFDDRCNIVLVITDAGKAAVAPAVNA